MTETFADYPGYVRRLTEERFLTYHDVLWRKRRNKGEPQGPKFNIYQFETEPKKCAELRAFIKRMRSNPPKYNLRARGESYNCVTFCIAALKESGIIPRDVDLTGRHPSPRHFDKEMAKLSLRSKNKYPVADSATLQPARFVRKRKKRL